MSNGFSLNVNGTKLNVQEGMEIKSQPKETQKVLSIFDYDENGILNNEGAIHDIEQFHSGVFEVSSEKINYKEHDKKGNLTYESNWKLNKDNKFIERTKDSNGDGKIDYVSTWEYDTKGNVTKITEDTNGDGKIDVIEEYN